MRPIVLTSSSIGTELDAHVVRRSFRVIPHSADVG
jgi:hypothetical protein